MPDNQVLLDGTAAVRTPLLIDDLRNTLEAGAEDAIAFLPALFAGMFILVIGYIVGRALKSVAVTLIRRIQVDLRFQETTVGELLGVQHERRSGRGGAGQPRDAGQQGQQSRGGQQGQPSRGGQQGQPSRDGQQGQQPGQQHGPVANAVGVVVEYYIILFALLLAAERWGIDQMSVWVERLLEYAPEFLAGVAIILVGVVFAEYAGRRTRDSHLVAESEYGVWITALVRGALYFVVLVVGLEMIGIDLRVVYMVVDGLSSGIGVGITVGIALAVGVAAGLVVKDYYEEEIQT
jgi:hypothetical protein